MILLGSRGYAQGKETQTKDASVLQLDRSLELRTVLVGNRGRQLKVGKEDDGT